MTASVLYPLTFAGTGMEEAEARVGLAHIMLGELVDGFRERLDGPGDLEHRVREIDEVLASAVRVAGVDPASGRDRCPGGSECFGLAHENSPSVGGAAASTVGAPGAAPTVAPPGD